MKRIFKFHSKSILPSLFLALYFSYCYEPMNNGIVSFNRVIGNMALYGGDVSDRVRQFYMLSIIIIPLLYFLIYSILSNVYIGIENKESTSMEGLEFVNVVSIVGIIPLILAWLSKFKTQGPVQMDLAIYICLLWISVFLTMDILKIYLKEKIPKYKAIKWGLLISIPLTLFFLTLQYKLKKEFNMEGFLGLYTFTVVVINLLIILWHNIIRKLNLDYNYSEKALQMSFVPFLLSSGIVSILIEIFNILNQHNIFIKGRVKIYILTYFILFLISASIYIYVNLIKQKWLYKFNMEFWYYIIIIISVVLVFAQIPLQSAITTDYFEAANHGLAISEFFRYGKIPIVETFDAHMLKVQLSGHIFGLLNGYSLDAVFVPYFVYSNILLYTFIYMVFSKIFNRDFAFIFTLIFPIYLDKAITLYFFGFITVLALIKAIKKQKVRNYFMYWISIGATCLYSLDVGMAFTVSTLIIFVLVRILYKEKIRWKALAITGVVIAFIAGTTFSLMCIFKDINPINRIREFLSIALSNQNWAINGLGHTTLISFVTSYVVIPTTATFLFILILYKVKQNKDTIDMNKFIFMATGFLVFLVNAPRGIIRHSLASHMNHVLLYSLPIFIALAFTVLIKRNRYKVFTVSYFLTLMVFGGVLGAEIPVEQSLLDMTFKNYSSYEQFKGDFSKKATRVKLDNAMAELGKSMKYTFDNIFEQDETYLDFTNQSLLYALTDREKPVYINQSPGLLNDVYSQEQFIEEVNNSTKRVSFALMPIDDGVLTLQLDGVKNSYKYYLVSEYISKNYTPLFKIKGFAIWCLNDEYESKVQRLNEFMENNKASGIKSDVELINEYYGDPKLLHRYDLMQVPYIWGTYDEKNSAINCNNQSGVLDNVVLSNGVPVIEDIDLTSIDKSTGNYIKVNGDSDNEGIFNVELGMVDKDSKFTTAIAYSFNIVKGEDINYMLRVSSDFLWYLGNVNSIRVTSNTDMENVTISILKGD
ncbi:MAG: hypothetical protein RSA29_15035 [Clostridium sp.]|uniref:hypothetical protein n=1 Tax=Clostridium sp. TaxID=1506 RepID=UPI003049B849